MLETATGPQMYVIYENRWINLNDVSMSMGNYRILH